MVLYFTDLRPISGTNPLRYEYEALPPVLYKSIVLKLKETAWSLRVWPV